MASFTNTFGGGYDGIYNFIAKLAGADYECWSIGDWTGDHIVVFKAGDGRVGILNHCYGSCSHCDAYEGCSTESEIQELAEHYRDSTQWFDSKEEALKHCEEKWCEGDAGYHIDSSYKETYKDKIPAFINQ